MKRVRERRTERCEGASTSLLADLLQNLAGGLPGDSLQSEQTYREPLREQAFQRAAQVLGEKRR